METVADRIRRLIEREFDGNRKTFCYECRISPGTLNPVLAGYRNPSHAFLMNLLEKNPSTCITELLTRNCPCTQEMEILNKEIERLESLIEFLWKNPIR